MTISGINVDPMELLSKAELLDILYEYGESDRALAHIRDRYQAEFKDELVWRYPISDGYHLGTFIVPVKEGFLSLPFDNVDSEDYELLELVDTAALDTDAMQTLIDDWRLFSDDLINAMNDMLCILRGT
jgi:hypothetical protein